MFGGSGFLGSYVSDELTRRKYDVLIVDLVESAYLNSNQKFLKCDIMNDDITVTYAENERVGHYEVTPYSYQPNMASKLVSNSFIDMGQGLVSCINHIDSELHKEADKK